MKNKLTILASMLISTLGYGQLRVNDQGQIGLRVLTPVEDIELSGKMKLYGDQGAGNGAFYLDNSGYIGYVCFRPQANLGGQLGTSNRNFLAVHTEYLYYTTLSATSDERVKENVVDLNEVGANPIYNLRPVSYDFKSELYKDLQGQEGQEELVDRLRLGHFGFLAQEVEKVIPELVNTDNKEMFTLNYVEMIPFLVSAVKEQKDKIDELTEVISELTEGTGQTGELGYRGTYGKVEVLTVAPNPTSDYSTIQVKVSDFEGVSIMVTKLDGHLVTEFKMTDMDQSFTLDGNTLVSKGIYLVSVVKGSEILKSEKLVYK